MTGLINYARAHQLRSFNLSSFMTGPPLNDVYEKIDRSMQFFSVYVVMERLHEDLWEDSRYVDKKEVRLCSLVVYEVRRYWWNRNTAHLSRIEELLESYKNDSIYSKMTERELRDKAIKALDQEIFPLAVEKVKEHYQEIYEDKWEAYWKKEDPFKPRIEYEYHRHYDMPPPFNRYYSHDPWRQYYFARNKNSTFYHAQGGSGNSDHRYNHGFYGHLFALLNNEKPVPTYFFTYDSRNRFIFNREEKSLCLNFFDLVGNFKIDREESARILEGVGKIPNR